MNDTIIALATPAGESSVGVIRLSGANAAELCLKTLLKKNELSDRSPVTARIADPESGEALDEALVTLFRSPRSYTGEDVVEISCHGNPFLIREIVRLFIRLGARPARPGEFTERAYLNGKMDLTQAEAVNDLIRSHTPLSRGSALGQLEGRLTAKIAVIHNGVLDLLAKLEAAIDHGDIEEEFISRSDINRRLDELNALVENLLKTAPVGKITRSGLRLAIVGAPNTGKSSLMNLLLKEDRVIVSDIPGTTRDIIEDELDILGIPVRLIDTAGVRSTDDALEKKGIERTSRAIDTSDLRVIVFDSSRPILTEDRDLFAVVRERKNICVLNKSDLPVKTASKDIEREFGVTAIPVSASRGDGLNDLEKAISEHYHSYGFDPYNDTLVTNIRQETLLRQTGEALTAAKEAAGRELSEEFIASSVRKARLFVEEIAGRTTDETILDRIFSEFCIGK